MGIRVDGKGIAERLSQTIMEAFQAEGLSPRLAVLVMTDDLAIQKFLISKSNRAQRMGVEIEIIRLPMEYTTKQVIEQIRNAEKSHDGVILQLPLQPQVDYIRARNALTVGHDVDVISDAAMDVFRKGGKVFPPVAGAIQAILEEHHLSLMGKVVVVVGQGRLVGEPAAIFALREGAQVTVVTEDTPDIEEHLKRAEVLILGAGDPGFLTPDMIRDGVVIIDAGTSEAKGKLSGDMDPACANKAALYTPVPGGVGPITVAMIFKNLLELARDAA